MKDVCALINFLNFDAWFCCVLCVINWFEQDIQRQNQYVSLDQMSGEGHCIKGFQFKDELLA